MELVGPIIEVIKCFGGPTRRYIHHHRKLEENVLNLRSKVANLNIRKRDTELRKGAEDRCGKVVKREVEIWLEDVERINAEMQNIEDKVRVVSYFSRGRLGKLVVQKIEEVERIYQQGNFPEGVAVEGPPRGGINFLTPNLEGETDVKKEIWKYLMGDEVGMIGVCGMGGIGKTTIMRHINNELLEGNQFDKVIWVTVSKEWSIFKLQEVMAHVMEIQDNFPTDELQRSAKLQASLEPKRYVLILDDVWEKINLCDLGVTEAKLGKEIKVVFTSRSIEVCKCMGCIVIRVQPLSEEESMTLFLRHVGDHVRQNREVEDVAKKIVEQCGGLPLALKVIGCSMKGEDDICEWRNALKELEERVKSVKGLDTEIFEQLKFSYDRLKNYPKIQNCFLYCSLYPEDFEIKKIELIESWIDEGLLDDLETRKAMHDRGHSIINKLVNNCLLEKAMPDRGHTISKKLKTTFWFDEDYLSENADEERVKMHDLLRDMALNIKSGDHFLVKAGAQLIEVPGENKWKMHLEKVSLMENFRLEFPLHLSPRCPHLTTLLLQGCPQIKLLSESFFMHMPALKVLNLSYTRITHLPNSISFLKNLSTLILVRCRSLRFVPSLTELKALRKLNLLSTNIEEVPQGIEMLQNLTFLVLSSVRLKDLPVGIISTSFSHLQYLAAGGMHLRAEEVGKLKKLEILFCSFCDLHEFEKYVRLIQGKFPTNFCISVGSILRIPYTASHDRMFTRMLTLSFKDPMKVIKFRECEMEKIDSLMVANDLITSLDIDECDDLKNLNKNPLFHKAKECRVCNCKEMECVVDLSLSSSSCSFSAVQSMEGLTLGSLSNLEELMRVSVECPTPLASTIFIFSSLKQLILYKCPRVEMLFPVELLQALQSLEMIEVRSCVKMEKIFEEGNIHKVNERTTSVLPKLKSLFLYSLPNLKGVCSVGIIQGLHNLEDIDVMDCEKMEKLFGEENIQKGNEGKISILPKLELFRLGLLPRLKSICRVGITIPADHLQLHIISDCPQLKRIPLCLPLSENSEPYLPHSLQQFVVRPMEWWESVELDDPSAKDVLSPFASCGIEVKFRTDSTSRRKLGY